MEQKENRFLNGLTVKAAQQTLYMYKIRNSSIPTIITDKATLSLIIILIKCVLVPFTYIHTQNAQHRVFD